MKKSYFLMLTILMGAAASEATFIKVGGPGIELNEERPVRVAIVNQQGISQEQTAYYNQAAGGIDIDTTWAGPNTSIYFPELGTGYLWYNGFWVDPEGYYWQGGNRIHVRDPNWRGRWNSYWQTHWHQGWRGQPDRGHGREWHEGREHESRRFEGEHRDERGAEHFRKEEPRHPAATHHEEHK